MLSRRSILRALGLGAPAVAVAAAVGAPAVAEAALTTKWPHAATLAFPSGGITGERLDVSRLHVIDANMGSLAAGQIRVRAGDLHPHTVIDLDRGILTIRS